MYSKRWFSFNIKYFSAENFIIFKISDSVITFYYVDGALIVMLKANEMSQTCTYMYFEAVSNERTYSSLMLLKQSSVKQQSVFSVRLGKEVQL